MQDQNKRGFWGVIIPVEILDSQELTASEKIIYAYVASFQKVCFESNETIAAKTCTGERSVSRALQKLEELGYIYVEFINNDNSKRRLYAVFENPKKLAYLASKGMFKSYQQSRQNGERGAENDGGSRQNGENSCQNGESPNGGESRQIGDHRIKNTKEYSQPEQKPNGMAGLAGEVPARLPKRSEYESQEEFEKALYAWNTMPTGAAS